MLDKLEVELKIRGFTKHTIKSYKYQNKKFLEFIEKQPEEITNEDVKSYMAHLMTNNISAKTVNLVLSAISFLHEGLMKKSIMDGVPRPKTQKKLPTVLSKEEIENLIAAPENFKHRLLIETLYATGLRVSECVSLKINDLDFNEKTGLVRDGKGQKDRNIKLSDTLIEHIKEHLNQRKDNNPHLFNIKDRHLSVRQAQKIVNQAAIKAGIKKRVFCHALRSSFATHLHDDGVDVRTIQVLLGHSSLDTTQIYTEVSTKKIKEVTSPLDTLNKKKK